MQISVLVALPAHCGANTQLSLFNLSRVHFLKNQTSFVHDHECVEDIANQLRNVSKKMRWEEEGEAANGRGMAFTPKHTCITTTLQSTFALTFIP